MAALFRILQAKMADGRTTGVSWRRCRGSSRGDHGSGFETVWPRYKIPIGAWGKAFFDFLTDNFNVFFRGLSDGLNFLLDGIVDSCFLLPPVLLAALIALLAWYLQRSQRACRSALLIGLLFIINQDLWKQTVETLVLVVAAAAASMAIGVPLGIWAAHKPKVYRVMLPVLDLMQTLPTFVYLIPVLTLFGLGTAPGLIVTIIFVIPTAVRLTHLGMISVPEGDHRGWRSLRRDQAPAPVEGRTARGPAHHHGRPDAMHHAVAVDGGVRRADRRRRPRHRDQPGARLAQDRPRP